MPANFFDHDIAATYDADSAAMFAPDVLNPTVDLLAELADGGDVLELGVGTGRVALALRPRVARVAGIELSAAMVERMRANPGGDDIEVVIGDFATATAPGSFRLVYLVFNTIMNLTTQDEQVACFANAAAHLEPGGRFVVEVGVPDLQRLPFGETARPFTITPTRLGFDEYDVVNQGMVSHHYRVTGAGMSAHSVPFRYVWPAELDLMARLGGMTLRDRWAGWRREPFTATSTSHISVWEKSAV